MSWYRNNLQLEESERIRIHRADPDFYVDINPILEEDAGSWACVISSLAGQIRSAAKLKVNGMFKNFLC